MKNKKIYFILLFCFLLLITSIIKITFAQIVVNMDTNKPVNLNLRNFQFATIDGNIKETGKIISYHDGHYVTNVKGEIVIENNGNYDLYSVNIPFHRNNDLYLIETSNTGYLHNTSIHVPILLSGEKAIINYQYIGLTLTKPDYSETNILNTAIKKDQIRMYSDIQLNLKKGPLENQSGDFRRLISVNIRNPSNFIIQAINIKVTKTEPGVMDINNNSRIWKLKDTILIPRTMMVADILDYTDEYSEIYWISADTSVASYNMTAESYINHLTEKNISGQLEQEIRDEVISQQINKEMPFDNQLLLKKFISKNQINPNEIITIQNLIYNFEDVTKIVNLEDYIPENFELVNITTNETRNIANLENNTLQWKEIKINPGSARIFSYNLRFNNSNITGIQYIKGSKITFSQGSISSENIPIILQYLPEKKLFIQKKIKILNDDEFLVEILIENVGESSIENLVLKDDIPEENTFSEITKPFLKRGVWQIQRINSQDSWHVSYVTNNKNSVQSIPLVFGIEQDSAYITLTVENLIKTQFINKMQITEKIGLFLTGLVCLAYLIIATKKRK